MRKWQLSDKICEVHLTSVCILFLSLMLAAFLFSIKDFIRAGLPLRALLVVLSLVESVVTTSVSPAPSMEAIRKSSSPKSSSNADKKASAGTSAQSWRSKELDQYKHKPSKSKYLDTRYDTKRTSHCPAWYLQPSNPMGTARWNLQVAARCSRQVRAGLQCCTGWRNV